MYKSVSERSDTYSDYASGGQLSGTEGQSRKIKKLSINTPIKSGVSYRAYINSEWTSWYSGNEEIARSNPTRVGYIFKCWSGSYENIKSDIEITAQYDLERQEDNTTTIYYNGYENPYIHYKVGNGNWDSNGGSNYLFGTGYYTYCNGNITKIEKPSSELRVTSIISSEGDSIKCGSPTNITINASGGEGSYTYTMYYSAYGSGRTCYLLHDSKNNTAEFIPTYSRTETLYITVTDEAGNMVKYQKQL